MPRQPPELASDSLIPNLILFLAIIVVSSESYAQGVRLTAHLVQSGVLGSSCAKSITIKVVEDNGSSITVKYRTTLGTTTVYARRDYYNKDQYVLRT